MATAALLLWLVLMLPLGIACGGAFAAGSEQPDGGLRELAH
jgi:hypothetical protein